MTDRAAAEDWVRRYRVAWESNDPDDIRGLFAEDGRYFTEPSDEEPSVGAEAIVADWIAHADQPGDTEFEFEVIAVDGDLAVARCVSTYLKHDPPRVYDNLFVVRLADDGRASEFTDWYIERKDDE
jgi:uncharacterized protein (TIGR02246 family)